MKMARLRGTILLVAFVVLSSSLSFAADSSQIVSELPGQPSVEFKQYAGQITVNAKSGRALFYWFYEADQKNATLLPLAIWFNGGPGCSSVGNGALSELGPFRVRPDGTGLTLNEFAWNKAANLIFLESPHGVGFSYSNTSSDYETYSDDLTATDVLVFIVEWFKRFPEYSKNELYLTGESYAGHYVPTLAAKIIEYNSKNAGSFINLKGFAVGNPWTDAYFDNKGDTEFYHSHSLISDDTYQKLISNCDFANDLPIDAGSSNPLCRAAARDAFRGMDQIDVYNVYAPACNKDSKNSSSNSRKRKQVLHTEMLTAAYDPCVDSTGPYLNLEAVQKALNVIVRPPAWASCSANANGNYPKSDIIKSMLPVYRQLLSSGLKIWIFSGDVDGVVSTIATRSWIRELNLTVTQPWYAWDFQNQVGGWSELYSGLAFVTVRGAGHMVPLDKPEQALQVFGHFVEGKPLPGFQKNQ